MRHSMLSSFVIILQTCYKKMRISRTNASCGIACYHLLWSSCKLVAKRYASVGSRPRNPRFTDVHTGTKRRLDVKTSNRDSGISGSGRIIWHSMLSSFVIILQTCYKQIRISRTNASYGIASAVGNSRPFLTNLPFHEFPEIVNHELWLKCLGNSQVCQKRAWVADGCIACYHLLWSSCKLVTKR